MVPRPEPDPPAADSTAPLAGCPDPDFSGSTGRTDQADLPYQPLAIPGESPRIRSMNTTRDWKAVCTTFITLRQACLAWTHLTEGIRDFVFLPGPSLDINPTSELMPSRSRYRTFPPSAPGVLTACGGLRLPENLDLRHSGPLEKRDLA